MFEGGSKAVVISSDALHSPETNAGHTKYEGTTK